MRIRAMLLVVVVVLAGTHGRLAAQDQGITGDPAAIADARAMVESMGGAELWQHIQQLRFVHEWDVINHHERYMEHEVLDMVDIRSYVAMKSETYDRVRAYSPEHGYWVLENGEVREGSAESLENAMARGPYSIYRLARAIARNAPGLHISYGHIEGIPPAPALEFRYGDDEPGGWIILNARKEPMVWATTQYRYTFGPLARFGNVWVPDWATTNDGFVRYEMVSLEASGERPDASLFRPPSAARG